MKLFRNVVNRFPPNGPNQLFQSTSSNTTRITPLYVPLLAQGNTARQILEANGPNVEVSFNK